MKRLATITILLMLSASPLIAQQKQNADNIAKTIAPYVEESTVAVLRLDLRRVKLDPLFTRFEGAIKALFPQDNNQQQAMRQMTAAKTLMQMYISALTKAGATEVFAVISLESLPESPLLIVVPTHDKVDVDSLTPLLQMVSLQMPVEQKQIGDAVVIGSKPHLARFQLAPADDQHKRFNALKQSFAATGDAPLQLVVIPPDYVRRALDELVPTLPKELGGGPSSDLTRGFQWAAAGVNLPPNLKVNATVQSRDNKAAQAFAGINTSMLKALQAESKGQLPDTLVERLAPKVKGNQVTWTLTDKDIDGFIEDLKAMIEAEQKRGG